MAAPTPDGIYADNVTNESGSEMHWATKLAAGVGAVSMAAAGALYLANNDSGSNPIVDAQPAETRQTAAADASAKPAKPGDDEPPKAILDFVDYSPPGCYRPRNTVVTVIERQGIVDDVTVVVRNLDDDSETSRILIEQETGRWSGPISGIPSNKRVKLLALVAGPEGTTTLSQDVSKFCENSDTSPY